MHPGAMLAATASNLMKKGKIPRFSAYHNVLGNEKRPTWAVLCRAELNTAVFAAIVRAAARLVPYLPVKGSIVSLCLYGIIQAIELGRKHGDGNSVFSSW